MHDLTLEYYEDMDDERPPPAWTNVEVHPLG